MIHMFSNEKQNLHEYNFLLLLLLKVNNGSIPNHSFDGFFKVYHRTHHDFHWVRQLSSDILNRLYRATISKILISKMS